MRPPMSSDSEDEDYEGFSFGSEFDEVSTIFLSETINFLNHEIDPYNAFSIQRSKC